MNKDNNQTFQKNCTLYIVRHGESEGNVKQILQGQTDTPLTQEGEKQAKALADKLQVIHFDAVFSSDLVRAQRTAEIIALEKKLSVTTARALRERSYGRYEGANYEKYNADLQELLNKYQHLPDEEKFSFKPSSDIESDEELVSRAITFLREVAVAYAGKTVLIVSHGGLMWAFLVHLGFSRSGELPPGTVKNLGYIKLESDGVDFFVKETDGIEKKEWQF